MDGQSHHQTGGKYVIGALTSAGINTVVGIPGTQTLPMDKAIAQSSDINYVMARHETAVPHIAWGHYEASGELAATVTIPGPGDTNVMHGLKNALNDCVPFIHISADVNPEHRGKEPLHELDPQTFDSVVKENITVQNQRELLPLLSKAIETATSPPYGPVRIGIPSNILAEEFHAQSATYTTDRTDYDNEHPYQEAVDLLSEAERPLVHVGGGIRRAEDGPNILHEIVTTLDAPVTTTFKGKGVFPEDDPHYLAATGPDLPDGAEKVLDAADVVLALGTDLDGLSTSYWSMPLGDQLIHVNLDPSTIGAAYEPDVAIIDDVSAAGNRLLAGLRSRDTDLETWNGGELAAKVRDEFLTHLESQGMFAESSPAHTPKILRDLRELLPDETIVTSDVGNYLVWARQLFEVYDPQNFITAGSWAGMGIGVPAAIGAKLAAPDRPVVSLTGDGGLFMCLPELHTAAEYDLDIVVVVFNNSDYGIISKKPQIEHHNGGRQFEWKNSNFAQVAEGLGCKATRVSSASEAIRAVRSALAEGNGPEVVEVMIEEHEPLAADTSDYDSRIEVDDYTSSR